MAALPSQPRALATQETTQEFIGYLEILEQLFLFGQKELGSSRAKKIVQYALAPTVFSGLALTIDGFSLSTIEVKEHFSSVSNSVKREQYRKAIARVLNQLCLYLGDEQIRAYFTKLMRAMKAYGIELSFDEAIINQPMKKRGVLATIFEAIRAQLRDAHAPIYGHIAQDELLEEYSLLKDIFASLPDATVVVDRTYTILFANTQAEQLLGLAQYELVQKPVDKVLTFIEDNQLVPPTTYLPKTNNMNHLLYIGNKLLLKITGRPNIYVNVVSVRPEDTLNANIAGIITLYPQDKVTDLQLNQLDVVSITAHELKSPLTSMRGYLAMLQDELGSKLTKDELTFLTRMSVSTNQIITLIENLLDFAKIENKTLTLQKRETVYEDVIQMAIEDVSSNTQGKKISLVFKKAETPLPKISIDTVRVVEVLTNLLTNAINFSSQGSTVTVSAYEDNGNIITEVIDHGIGIPEEAIPKLFTKFYQVPSEHTSYGNVKGTGLGLYIAKEIITAHGGSIWVQSEVNKGSTFAFRLPLNEAQKKKIAEEKEATILVPHHRFFHSRGIPLVS